MCSTIPCYRLPEVLRDYSELKDISRVTLRQNLGLVWLGLWAERSQRLVCFRQARGKSPG